MSKDEKFVDLHLLFLTFHWIVVFCSLIDNFTLFFTLRKFVDLITWIDFDERDVKECEAYILWDADKKKK